MAEQIANEEISEPLQKAIDQSVKRAIDEMLNRLAETEGGENLYLRSQQRHTSDRAPYFDWKWAISTAIAIIAILSPVILVGLSGYFQIKTDLGIVRTKVEVVQTKVDLLQTDLNGLKSKVDGIEKQVGEIRVINNRLDGIEKTLARIETNISQRERGG